MKNPVHAALGLVLTLFGVAVQFVALDAHFLAAVQVIVYAGAIVVLFLFVIMLLGVDRADDLRIEPIPIQRPLAARDGRRARRPARSRRSSVRVTRRRSTRAPASPSPARTAITTPTSNSSPRTCSATTCSRSSSRRCC